MYKGEKFNSISHLIGAVLACAGVAFLLVVAIDKGDVYKIVGFSIYGAMMVALYAISTIYHSTKGKLKDFFRQMDYLSIYLMIAGSYTPFTLITLRGVWGWTLFTVIWALAILGIVQEVLLGKKTRKLSIFIYLLMG
jgi:hemolysin III